MSRSRFATRARKAALSLLAAGALVGGMLSGVPASAAPGDSGVEPQARPVQFKDGLYIVVLRQPGATTYSGGNDRFRATKPRPGGSFDRASDEVRTYTRHLRQTHRAVADRVGATVVHDFTVALNGFVARLTAEQAAEMVRDKRVLSVAPDERVSIDTWASPEHLGLTGRRGAWARAGGQKSAGAGVVVGVLDSGIWPESASFNGKVLNRRPKTKWDIHRIGDRTYMDKKDGSRFAGVCMTGEGFGRHDCNTKLIGARYYPEIFEAAVPVEERNEFEFLSPRDGDGHGTHTASTAAGNMNVRARVAGRRFGKISGMAPAARIAAYKVCYSDQDPGTGDCYTSASLAAIDEAVADGVDVLNYSISGSTTTVLDAVEIAFHGAASGGVFVATSAGNSGPGPETVAHASPWLTTVAASTHVRFENTVVLGNGQRFVGASFSQTRLPQTPLVDSSDVAAAGVDPAAAEICDVNTLDPAQVEGKIVVCTRGVTDRVAKSVEVERAGGVGMILANPTEGSLDADVHSVPTIHIQDDAAAEVWEYIEAAGPDATAAFRLGNRTGVVTPVPQVAGFSSRGPSLANDADILKPDIAAPGVSVLAAVAPPSNNGRSFDLYSGTSMAAPHIAGLAAFMYGERPNWLPTEIKSAMMTTARPLREANGRASQDAFAQGAGEVRPRKFFKPGLFVVPSARDFVGFLSSLGYESTTNYGTPVPPVAAKDINQPSMATGQVVDSVSFNRQFRADRKGTWRVTYRVPGFEAELSTKRIRAKRAGDIEDLTVTFRRTTAETGQFVTGHVTLVGPTRVRIPVALRPVSVAAPSEVTGTGTTGSTEVEITAGSTGDLDVEVHGLDAAETHEGVVEATEGGAFDDYCVTLTDETQVFRANLDAAPAGGDTLDMYVYGLAGPECDSQIVSLAGLAATGSGDEQFTWENPTPGTYLVSVELYSPPAGASSVDYVLDMFNVDGSAPEGSFAAEPNPVPVTSGQETTFDAVWSGLAPDTRYFGFFEYEGALNRTYATVDTSTP